MDKREFTPKSLGAAFAAWAGYFTSPNTMIAPLVSLFMVPMAAEFGMTRTEISWLNVISPWAVALVVPWSGVAIDRWGLRRVLIPACIAFGLAQFLIAWSQTWWELVAATVFLSILAGVHCAVGYAKTISLWFHSTRGIVLGAIVALGGGIGAIIMPQYVRYLIDQGFPPFIRPFIGIESGWRAGYMGLGLVVFLVGLPILFFFLREPAGTREAAAAARAAGKAGKLKDNPNAPGLTFREALKTRELWLLAVAIFLGSMAIQGTVAHAVPLLTEKGVDRGVATTVLSFMFVGGLVGQFGAGVAADWWQNPKFGFPFFAVAAIGLITVHSAAIPALLLAGAVMQGFGKGGENSVLAYLASRYFGLRSFGSLYALLFAASNLGIGVGIVSMGFAHDLTGSYDVMRYVFGAATIVSAALLLFGGKYVFAAKNAPDPEETAAASQPATS